MFVHCCVHHIITSDDKIDSWILTSPLDTISEIHLNLLASWYRLVFFSPHVLDRVHARTLGRLSQNLA